MTERRQGPEWSMQNMTCWQFAINPPSKQAKLEKCMGFRTGNMAENKTDQISVLMELRFKWGK